ncbi:MAG: hypothetical protein K0M45_02270 [Candidatus Paracaedibacteraceae bacterium]|nr:hypothetical protein [Candidatus Paracaedibacteraceae bacterium]
MTDVNSKELIAKLGAFTLSFELLFLSMQEMGEMESVGEISCMHNALFPMIQKTYNTYMWAYEKLINRPLDTLGDLNFFQPEVSIPKNLPKAYLNQLKGLTHSNNNAYLFYMRDENGYVLFNLKTRNKITTNLYYTAVRYQLGNQPTARGFVFSITPSNRVCIVENQGWLINKEKNKYSLSFYNGKAEEKPFTIGQGIYFFDPRTNNPLDRKISIIKNIDQQIINMARSLKDNHTVLEREKLLATINRLMEQQKKNKESLMQEAKVEGKDLSNLASAIKNSDIIRDVQSLLPFRHNIHLLLDDLLENKEEAFIGMPTLPVEILEVEYLFVKELLENSRKENLKAQEFSQQYIKACFPDQRLENLVQQYEEKLLTYYEAEEKEKLEESLREPDHSTAYQDEWARRARMVAQGEHYKKSPRKKKTKKRSQAHQPLIVEKKTKNNLQSQVLRTAKQRLAELPNKPIKFKNYLKLINKVTHSMSESGVQVTGQLNASSHGCLVVGDKKISIVRPHGRYDTIHPKSAHSILDELVNSYFYVQKQ